MMAKMRRKHAGQLKPKDAVMLTGRRLIVASTREVVSEAFGRSIEITFTDGTVVRRTPSALVDRG